MSQGLTRAVGLPVLVASGCLGLSACGDGKKSAPPSTRAPETTAAPEGPPKLAAARVESQLKKILGALSLPAVPTTLYPKGGGPPQQSQIGGGRLKVRSVTCPRDIPLQKGGVFTCDVSARHVEARVRLKQLDARGSRLNYTTSIKSEVGGGIPVETRLHGRFKLK